MVGEGVSAQEIDDSQISGVSRDFPNRIAGLIEVIGVVAKPTDQAVGTHPAIEGVAHRISQQGIVEGVSGSPSDGAAKDHPLDLIGEGRVGNCGEHRVEAASQRLDDEIGDAVHEIVVVAAEADKCIDRGASAAVECVVGVIAKEGIGHAVSGQLIAGAKDSILNRVA